MRQLLLLAYLVPALLAMTIVPASADQDYARVIDLTFPVAGPVASYPDSYDACRGHNCSRRHKATDVMTAHGQAVHAAVGGTISYITGIGEPVPSYGYMITIAGDDGRAYSYIHLGPKRSGRPHQAYATGLRRGVRVERGQLIGFSGCSGNASCSAPHLHLEIEDPTVTDPYKTHQMNPYASLKAAQRRGDVPRAGRFADVPPTSSHFAGIEAIATAGITVGCGDKSIFCPKDPVTRAEMATFLARAVDLEPVQADAFTDVAASSSHRTNINAIHAAGITVGCGDGTTYCPDDDVTRDEMATFLARAFDLAAAGAPHFTDVDPGSSHAANIAAIYAAGITVGCGDKTTYCPDDPVTREEMATFLARALGLV